ncbi:MAG: hypothetical protein SO471_15110 [Anaerobutyricum hallii]|nr:hypothetical protein [Anaerobutyricum hallii]MDY4579244.1 hypothetical protein [Anaerobutyricum hallii]
MEQVCGTRNRTCSLFPKLFLPKCLKTGGKQRIGTNGTGISI